MNKIKVGLIYGGASPEHDVSLMTAKSIREHIDNEKFDVVDIFINKNGQMDESLLENIDVAFLAVHGPNCEDGKLQKLLENRSIKYTGPGIEASKLNMEKIAMHDAFKAMGLPVVEYRGFAKNSIDDIGSYVNEIGLPIVVKPNNGGSSIGMSKIDRIEDLEKAINNAFKYDDKICIEKALLDLREIELGVLGNDDLIISKPGEVLSNGEFYSYENKYFKPFLTTTETELNDKAKIELKDMAQKAYKTTGCRGYSRVDFFLSGDKFYINEINTLPGFTSTSMYPKLMANIGISYRDLITKIIEFALE
jgi:D-alanine-D-alanine ligase